MAPGCWGCLVSYRTLAEESSAVTRGTPEMKVRTRIARLSVRGSLPRLSGLLELCKVGSLTRVRAAERKATQCVQST